MNLRFGLTLATAAGLCAISAFWSMPPALLRGLAAAGGIAVICSIANLGGLVGPYILAWARAHLQSSAGGLYAVAGFLVLAVVLTVLACRRIERPGNAPGTEPGGVASKPAQLRPAGVIAHKR